MHRKKVSRISWLHIGMMILYLSATPAFAATAITVHKSPTCGCCEKYVDYLRDNGFKVEARDEQDMSAVKKRHGVAHAASCHTGLIDGYVVEGHVPVAAIRKLLQERPAIIGISAPGMPMNSPGMGEMHKGTLTIYAIPKGDREPYVYSVE
ncbi:MAG: DUF411 domain-containing protein [Pseudomonadota bacterium]